MCIPVLMSRRLLVHLVKDRPGLEDLNLWPFSLITEETGIVAHL